MDPNECLRLLVAAIARGDKDETKQYREHLLKWLNRGGFEPYWGPYQELRRSILNETGRWAPSAFTKTLAKKLGLGLWNTQAINEHELNVRADERVRVIDEIELWLSELPETPDFQVLGEYLSRKKLGL